MKILIINSNTCVGSEIYKRLNENIHHLLNNHAYMKGTSKNAF